MLRANVTWQPVTTIPILQPQSLHLWYMDLTMYTQATSTIAAMLQPVTICSAAELAQAAMLKNKQQFLYSRALRRYVLAGYLGMDANLLQFNTGPQGKPYLAWPATNLCFSISHAANICVLAVYRGLEIGLDIEVIRPRYGIASIARRMFASAVSVQLTTVVGEEARLVWFYKHWTHLEASVKARGESLFHLQTRHAIYPGINFIPAPGFRGCIAAANALPPRRQWGCFCLLQGR